MEESWAPSLASRIVCLCWCSTAVGSLFWILCQMGLLLLSFLYCLERICFNCRNHEYWSWILTFFKAIYQTIYQSKFLSTCTWVTCFSCLILKEHWISECVGILDCSYFPSLWHLHSFKSSFHKNLVHLFSTPWGWQACFRCFPVLCDPCCSGNSHTLRKWRLPSSPACCPLRFMAKVPAVDHTPDLLLTYHSETRMAVNTKRWHKFKNKLVPMTKVKATKSASYSGWWTTAGLGSPDTNNTWLESVNAKNSPPWCCENFAFFYWSLKVNFKFSTH